ncbi:hypothetical protein KSP39_PZI019981 [Platanthera zijinensis]|uniref:Exopolygalacturonase n=1 Tax=Platanthera zijinensis TaxID=2320716 RepID=A0AAP0AYZ0_9ASPA
MARPAANSVLLSLILAELLCFSTVAMAAYNVVSFGAKPDGRTDSAPAFMAAWKNACSSGKPATMVVPEGQFLVSRALFQGPCKNNKIRIFIEGSLVGYYGYSGAPEWITFKYVTGVSVYGGTFDARGQSLWACKAARRHCPNGSRALTISQSKDVLLSGVKVMNSENFQVGILFSRAVTVEGATITAPWDSPNTDGIHLHMSTGVTITGSTMRTGDDCISIGEGVSNTWIQNIHCGPGHGISIGSLGGSPGNNAGVQNVTVSSVAFAGTQNGFRIKTWATPYKGFVKGVTFQHAAMINVKNPIIIDQNYCPDHNNCPNQSSGIKITDVVFNDVHGTSAKTVAINLECSPTNPCRGIELRDIKLSYKGEKQQAAQSLCDNVHGISDGVITPPSCL